MKLKGLVRAALTLGMIAAMSMTTLAAGSKTDKVDTVGGNATVGTTTQTVKAEDLQKLGVTGNVLEVVDVKFADGAKSGTVTFNMKATAKVGDVITVLHYNGTAWEKVGDYTVDANGNISPTFNSLSPVAFVLKTAAAAPAAPAPAKPGASPKTGEMNMVMLAGMLAALGTVSGVAVLKRKRA